MGARSKVRPQDVLASLHGDGHELIRYGPSAQKIFGIASD